MKGISRVAVVVLAVFTGFVLACGRGGGPSGYGLRIASPGGEFTLAPLGYGDPDPSQRGSLSLEVTETSGGNKLVAVAVEGAKGYKSALFHLEYDASRFSPVSVKDAGFLPGALFLGVTDYPGVVAVGAVIPRPMESEGASGSGRIAEIEFAPRPFEAARKTSGAPKNEENKITTASVYDNTAEATCTITFIERNQGDYDLNGEVSVADITPVALHYLETTSSGNPATDPIAVIDGDGNGEIGVSDITPIAVNYLNSLDGYAVRWGIDDGSGNVTDMGDIPFPSNPEFPFTINRPAVGDGLRPRYQVTHRYGLEAAFTGSDATNLRYWIRPCSGGEYGIEGGPFSTSTNPGGDTAPPTWLSGLGIIAGNYNIGNTEINITFGEATDADSPPVSYWVYWQVGETLDYADARASGRVFEVDVTGQSSPFNYTITDSDGAAIGETLSIGVHARDSAVPPNETPEYNPHPLHPGGADWLVVEPGSGAGDVPPTWLLTIGITEADPGDQAVNVGWGLAYHSEGEPSYEVYWAEGDLTGSPLQLFTSGNHTNVAGATSYRVTGLTNDQIYSFGVKAVSPRGLEDQNLKVLTATPAEGVFPFQVPEFDTIWDCGVISNDSDIVLTPIDNAPVIAYTMGPANRLALCYYDGFDWVHEVISENGRFDHPSIEIRGDTLLVSAYNRAAQALEVYTGDVNAQNWQLDVVDSSGYDGKGFEFCWTSTMEYFEPTDTIGIVYNAGVGTHLYNDSESVLKYAFKSGSDSWTTETIQTSEGMLYNSPGASFVFTPDGIPSVAYDYGNFDPSPMPHPIYKAYVYYGIRDSGEWTVEKVPGDWMANQAIFLTYNTVTEMPFIAMGRDRDVYLGFGQSVPINDAVVAWKDAEGNWQDQVLAEGDALWDGAFVITTDFEGPDPVICFNKAGQGFFYYSYVHAVVDYSEAQAAVDAKSYLTRSTFNGIAWTAPERLQEDPYLGCSAINLAIDITEARLSFQEIGVLDYAPYYNQFPEGELVYWQF
ncbi:MAG: hypothetical protein HRF49_08120 [bacterium]|jgi:hypothetical protein